jgi:cytochrome P450
MYLTHRDPDVWRNPDGFDPTRFLAGRHSGGPQRCNFIPFTAGRRICLGNTFAVIEATLLASMIAQRYELDLAAGPKEAEPTLTLRPRGGLPMRLRHR